MIFKIFTFFILLNIPFVTRTNTVSKKEGELIIQLKTGVQVETILNKVEPARNPEFEIQAIKQISKSLNIWLIQFNPQKSSGEFLIPKFYHFDEVINAQYNHILIQRTTPNDSLFNLQWQYINDGIPLGKADADIDIDSAWNYTTGGVTVLGDTIVVAIIDDGMDEDHPDMVPNLWVNRNEIPKNGFDDDGNGYKDDYRGWNDPENNDDITNTDPIWGPGGSHGTPVAGIVGAAGNNSIGVAGINWNVKLMIIVHDNSITESSVLSAYSYVLEMRKLYNETNGEKGAFVVATNSSWGINYGQPSDAPIWCAMYDSLGKYGVLSAGATANLDVDVDKEGDLPTACSSEYLISVTNTDMYDQKEYYAGFGDTTIDLGAPGSDTYTVALSTSGPVQAYDQFGGTSGATPHVAGSVALLYSAPADNIAQLAKEYPAATARLIKKFILEGTDSKSSLSGKTVSGGRLNLFNSMKLLIAYNDSTTGFSISNENNSQSKNILIYPNPANDYINIFFSDEISESIKVDITNILGQVVFNKTHYKSQLDVKNLPSGIYYLTFYDDHEIKICVKKAVVLTNGYTPKTNNK